MANRDAGLDACNNPVQIGDTLMVAKTHSQAGISWKRGVVTRMTDKSCWFMVPAYYEFGDIKKGDLIEDGPHKLANSVKIT
jgi:hypothetical protein